MKALLERTKVLVLRAGLAPALALAALVVPQPAAAQALPSPYGYDPYGPYPPRPMIEAQTDFYPGALRGYVARILARHGYRLMGPLRPRGDAVVASGVDAGGRRTNFLIDPNEGEVLRAWPLGPGFGQMRPRPGPVGGPYDLMEEGALDGSRVYRPSIRGGRTDVGRDGASIARHGAEVPFAGRRAKPSPDSAGNSARLVVPRRPPPQAMKVPGIGAGAPIQLPQAPTSVTATPEARTASGQAASPPAPIQPNQAMDRSERSETTNFPKSPSKQSFPARIENETTSKSNIGE